MDDGNEPYGSAWATKMRTYASWINNEFHEHDFALLTLDSDIGLQTGWMGIETRPTFSSVYTLGLNLAGYPGDLDGGLNMYHDYDIGTDVTNYNHWYDIDTSGGQSGGPVWRYDGTDRYILTVHAYSDDGSGSNHGTRLDKNKYDIINNWITADETLTDKPDMANRGESYLDLYSDFNPTTVGSGLTNFNVWCDIQNIGTLSTGTFTVSYYASANPTITEEDYLIGTDTVSSINPTYSADSSWSGIFPSGVPSGLYYIGWIIDSNDNIDEFNENNNVGIVSSYKLLVDASPPSNPTVCLQTIGSTESDVWQDNVTDPEFIWSGASDSYTSVAGYYYYWGTDPFGTSSSYTTSLGYDPPAVSTGAYYLRVKTQDSIGNNASWNTLYIFKYNESLNDDGKNPVSLPDENPNAPSDDDDDDDEPNMEIPGYEIYVLITVICVISIICIKKQLKKIK